MTIIAYTAVGVAVFVVMIAVGSLVGKCIHYAARREEQYARWLAELAETSDAQRGKVRRASTTRPR
jgi:hypothetical protein